MTSVIACLENKAAENENLGFKDTIMSCFVGRLISHNHYNSSLLASKNASDHDQVWRQKHEPPSKDAADLSLGNAKCFAGIALSLLMPGC